MARRVVLLVAALAATLLFSAAPAGAVTPFGSIATVGARATGLHHRHRRR